jgi:CubicO group peptidase (beta-lactamase class C family)
MTLRFLVRALAVGVALPIHAHAQQDARFASTRRVVDSVLRATATPGISVVVVRDDSILFARGFGLANIETRAPMTLDLLTQVGSVTKPITAALVLSLVADGMLQLNAPVSAVVSGLAPRVGRLTASQLLSQTSGLRDIAGGVGAQDESAMLTAATAIRDGDIALPVGVAFSYSNAGLSLAGVAAQEATRTPFADLLRDRLLVPLGMRTSTMRPLEALTYPFADGHERGTNGAIRVVRPIENNVGIWPAGYLHTSARELSRFVIALLNGGRVDGKQAIPASVVDSMFTSHVEIPSMMRGLRYGYGLMLDVLNGVPSAWHAGTTRGHAALIRMIPRHRLGVVVLANTEIRLDVVAEAALAEALGDPSRTGAGTAIRRGRSWRPATADELRAAEGHYENRLAIDLRLRADTLRLTGLGPERTASAIGVAPDGRLWLAVRLPGAATADTVVAVLPTATTPGFASVFLWALPRTGPPR